MRMIIQPVVYYIMFNFRIMKIIVIDLHKQQALDADPKVIHLINFTRNLHQPQNTFFIIEEAKETILDFSQGTVRVL